MGYGLLLNPLSMISSIEYDAGGRALWILWEMMIPTAAKTDNCQCTLSRSWGVVGYLYSCGTLGLCFSKGGSWMSLIFTVTF